MNETEKQKAIEILNKIMELELAGVVRYTHYALMVFGYGRIPIVSWLKGNGDESLAHASKAGEFVTMLGGHPSSKDRAAARNAQARHRRHSAREPGTGTLDARSLL